MKRLIALGAVLLAGCAQATPVPVVTVTATPSPTPSYTPSPTPTVSTEDEFIAFFEDEYGNIPPNKERQVVNIALQVCEYFDTYGVKATMETYGGEVASLSLSTAKMFGFIVGSGTMFFCPEHAESLESWTNGGNRGTSA